MAKKKSKKKVQAKGLAARRIAFKANPKESESPRPKAKAKAKGGPKTAKAPIASASAETTPTPPQLDRAKLLRAARGLRLHVNVMRQRLGPATGPGAVPWLRHGAACLERALAGLASVPDLGDFLRLLPGERCVEARRTAEDFVAALYQDARDLVLAADEAADREEHADFYAAAEGALANVAIDLGRFGEEPAKDDESDVGDQAVAVAPEPVEVAE